MAPNLCVTLAVLVLHCMVQFNFSCSFFRRPDPEYNVNNNTHNTPILYTFWNGPGETDARAFYCFIVDTKFVSKCTCLYLLAVAVQYIVYPSLNLYTKTPFSGDKLEGFYSFLKFSIFQNKNLNFI